MSKEPDNSKDGGESGPQFNINERVLVLDATRTPPQQPSNDKTNQQPPLYEAVIKQSALRNVDPVTKEVLSETKFAFAKKRGRRHILPAPNNAQQLHSLEDLEKEWCYLIHFLGWNSRHDRWMIESNVFPNTELNRKRLESNNTAKVVRATKPESAVEKKKKRPGRPKKENNDDTDNVENPYLAMLIDACILPFTLQRILVDDRDKITQTVYPPALSIHNTRDPVDIRKKGITMLHKLPSSLSIQNILAGFIEARKQQDLEEFAKERDKLDTAVVVENNTKQQRTTGVEAKDKDEAMGDKKQAGVDKEQTSAQTSTSDNIITKDTLKLRKKKRKQIALSILELLDAALAKFLLYSQERCQYEELMSSNSKKDLEISDTDQESAKRPTEIYGGEHILRFFVKLPALLAASTMPVEASEDELELKSFISEFIVYLQKNRAKCFKERYYGIYTDGSRCGV